MLIACIMLRFSPKPMEELIEGLAAFGSEAGLGHHALLLVRQGLQAQHGQAPPAGGEDIEGRAIAKQRTRRHQHEMPVLDEQADQGFHGQAEIGAVFQAFEEEHHARHLDGLENHAAAQAALTKSDFEVLLKPVLHSCRTRKIRELAVRALDEVCNWQQQWNEVAMLVQNFEEQAAGKARLPTARRPLDEKGILLTGRHALIMTLHGGKNACPAVLGEDVYWNLSVT
mmetsp:Transcript_92204/g.166521  ORF Transcript_92204/g.166521 Transcript_92204/m.166521 type:complete len:227 (+) Transcript_92204:736-1416(+)